MSPRQPVVTAKKLVYKNNDGLRAIIPVHAKFDLGTGLLAQILKDANVTIEELKELL